MVGVGQVDYWMVDEMLSGQTEDGVVEWSVDQEGVVMLERAADMNWICVEICELASILRAAGYDVTPKK